MSNLRRLGAMISIGAVMGIGAFAGFIAVQSHLQQSDAVGVSEAAAWLNGGGAGNEVRSFSTLGEMTEASDLVVTGTIVAVFPGREMGRPGIDRVYYAVATLRVEQVVTGQSNGEIAPGDSVFVDFFLGGNRDVESFADAIEGTSGLWFLFDKALEAERQGADAAAVARDQGLFMLASSRGLVVEESGASRMPFGHVEYGDEALFEAVESRSLDEVVSETRRIAGNNAASQP